MSSIPNILFQDPKSKFPKLKYSPIEEAERRMLDSNAPPELPGGGDSPGQQRYREFIEREYIPGMSQPEGKPGRIRRFLSGFARSPEEAQEVLYGVELSARRGELKAKERALHALAEQERKATEGSARGEYYRRWRDLQEEQITASREDRKQRRIQAAADARTKYNIEQQSRGAAGWIPSEQVPFVTIPEAPGITYREGRMRDPSYVEYKFQESIPEVDPEQNLSYKFSERAMARQKKETIPTPPGLIGQLGPQTDERTARFATQQSIASTREAIDKARNEMREAYQNATLEIQRQRARRIGAARPLDPTKIQNTENDIRRVHRSKVESIKREIQNIRKLQYPKPQEAQMVNDLEAEVSELEKEEERVVQSFRDRLGPPAAVIRSPAPTAKPDPLGIR